MGNLGPESSTASLVGQPSTGGHAAGLETPCVDCDGDMHPFPSRLLDRPFTRAEALACGVTPRGLQGKRFVRVFPRVWRHRDLVMTHDRWVQAGRLALPDGAVLTGISRIQQLGLDTGPRLPLHFVVVGDLHLEIGGIFLHRTVLLPPLAADGEATAAAAFVSYCTHARLIDAVKAGDWLLHHGHMTCDELTGLLDEQPWRDGGEEARIVAPFLNGRSRSVKESETRLLIIAAELPEPDVNVAVPGIVEAEVTGDLVYIVYLVVVEYEGAQHQEDRRQYLGDVDRYGLMRRHDVRYVQVTNEKLRAPRSVPRAVHAELRAAGYDGPPPRFDGLWPFIFRPVRELVQATAGRRAVG